MKTDNFIKLLFFTSAGSHDSETLIFSGYIKDLELIEKEKNIRPNPEVDAFMKVNNAPLEYGIVLIFTIVI